MLFAVLTIIIIAINSLLIKELPTARNAFGKSYIIKNSKDLNYCLNNKIKNVVISISGTQYSGFEETSNMMINGVETSSLTAYYYYIISFDNTKILAKYSNQLDTSKNFITGYLSEFESTDKQVYNELAFECLRNNEQ
ncbi:MAG: hypothetical protein M0R40_05935 [Firmicutes bacterium]|nr:hypothetical protein [Bacillota bacterium]